MNIKLLAIVTPTSIYHLSRIGAIRLGDIGLLVVYRIVYFRVVFELVFQTCINFCTYVLSNSNRYLIEFIVVFTVFDFFNVLGRVSSMVIETTGITHQPTNF